MGQIRQQRVAEAVRAELSELLQKELKDPRLGFASVVQVEMSRDLRHAKIYVSVYGSDQERADTLAALEKASGFLRRELTRRLRLRYAPQLVFIADDSIRHGARINELLKQLKSE
ncbi:MAG TPA: 30S ribosome-binding factor RbfA [Bacillota bacterium]